MGKEDKKHQGGSILADKHMETLDALLQAYEARLKPLQIVILKRDGYNTLKQRLI